jgi:hypothetical protein
LVRCIVGARASQVRGINPQCHPERSEGFVYLISRRTFALLVCAARLCRSFVPLVCAALRALARLIYNPVCTAQPNLFNSIELQHNTEI